VEFREGERLVLELDDGWVTDYGKAVLTDRRLIFTKGEDTTLEINLKHIGKVHSEVSFLGVVSMKIRIFGGQVFKVTFKCEGPKAILGSSYTMPKQKEITRRWVDTIDRLLPR